MKLFRCPFGTNEIAKPGPALPVPVLLRREAGAAAITPNIHPYQTIALRAMARVVTGHYGRSKTFRPGAYHAPTERDRERSKATQFLSHRGRTVCAPTERDAFPSSGRIPCAHRTGPVTIKTTGATLSPWAHSVRPDGAGRFPFVRAHIMRPRNGTNHDQNHRSHSLTVGAQCAPRRSGTLSFRPGAYHAPTEQDRERSKATQFLSHRGRTVCAPTERDAFLSSAPQRPLTRSGGCEWGRLARAVPWFETHYWSFS